MKSGNKRIANLFSTMIEPPNIEKRILIKFENLIPPIFLISCVLILMITTRPYEVGLVCFLFFILNFTISQIRFRLLPEKFARVEVPRYIFNFFIGGLLVYLSGPESPGWLFLIPPIFWAPFAFRSLFSIITIDLLNLLNCAGIIFYMGGTPVDAIVTIVPLAFIAVFAFFNTVFMQQLMDIKTEKAGVDRSSSAKSEFMARMSHEMRTPLNIILGMTDILLEGKLSEEQVRNTQVVQRAGNNMLALVNDVLDITRVEEGKIEINKVPIEIREFLDNIRLNFESLAHEKNLSLKFKFDTHLPKYVLLDEMRVRQILYNLLSNSLKFTEKGGVSILVQDKSKQVGKLILLFTVRDTGPGVPLSQQAHIFKSFTQADVSITRKYGGTGLGLSISRRLAELMGGKLWLDPDNDKGSAFHLKFPSEAMEISQPAPEPAPLTSLLTEKKAKVLKILIVEDTLDNQLLFKAFFKKSPHKLDFAMNGLEGLERRKEFEYDLIFMDMQMPIMDGYTATHEIRLWESLEGKNYVPIIALTAHALKEEVMKSIQFGCDAHLTKPISKKRMLEVVDLFSDLEYLDR